MDAVSLRERLVDRATALRAVRALGEARRK
jgi:hypothetical protein